MTYPGTVEIAAWRQQDAAKTWRDWIVPSESGARVMSQAQHAVRERFLAGAKSFAKLEDLDLTSAREFIALVDECAVGFNSGAGLFGALAAVVRYGVIQSCFPALVRSRRGSADTALRWISAMWSLHAAAFGALPESADIGSLSVSDFETTLPPEESLAEDIAIYNMAVSELLSKTSREAEARQVLRRLRTNLGIDAEELGAMFGVSARTIRQWESRHTPIPDKEITAIVAADVGLTVLLEVFRPEVLADVVRRNAPGFDGDRALDWILNGRIAEVAERYWDASLYQG
jgi:transcriptional regulator with XRE-family HTH domain